MALSAPLFTVTASAAAAAVSIAVPASPAGFPQGADCKAHSRGQRQQRDAASGQLVHHFPLSYTRMAATEVRRQALP